MTYNTTRRKPLTKAQDWLDQWSVPEPNTGCYLFLGAIGKGGYGNTCVDGCYLNAHVRSFETFKGKVPRGRVVRHTCDQKSCINPGHLILGSAKNNTADMFRRGRWPLKLSADDVLAIRSEPKTRGVNFRLAKQYGVSAVHVDKIRRNKARVYDPA